jgi:hypothetical protein
MTEHDVAEIRAMEAVLTAVSPLKPKEQVRVLAWLIEKLDLALDIKVAMKDARPQYRSYVELAWEMVPHLMDTESEFVSATAPGSMADRVLSIATFLQMKADDPDAATLTGRDINLALKRMRLPVSNVTDCIYTLMKRSPPHILEAGRTAGRKDWKNYRVTESGIDYIYQQIVQHHANGGRHRAGRD